ncbi:DUF5683 domain-containing protein [Mucilaginibacter segetis]|uniref:DUF5683 domain-containing protein n=1 Tax=Mucilaginibacter segetis TaxID=2793071 RepID=A0A934UKP6_9SPHI|nr:DUF5683 domain-containing protein [Mucilaginibacter segetis]MBK0377678.1 hypothetical protein [Mucilaginibacter segetis]
MLKQLVVLVLLLSVTVFAVAQNPDTTAATKTGTPPLKPDTVGRNSFAPKIKKEKVYHPDSTHIPSLAVKRSLIIPGWGQVYNHQIWKVPIIYGTLALLGAAIVYNQTNYKEFLALARIKQTGEIPQKPSDAYYAEYQKYKTDYDRYAVNNDFQTLANASDGFLRNRDLSILGVLGFWGIQTVDAYIQAKFISSYTVDSDLSIKVTPGLIGQPLYAANFNNTYIPGIKITFTLK